ncbi:MAG TPA: hypothetical protein VN939_15660, partial [Chthoniobacterales bacterium]|nr:hypothetical protein [Chthoniobacterales bacterium]
MNLVKPGRFLKIGCTPDESLRIRVAPHGLRSIVKIRSVVESQAVGYSQLTRENWLPAYPSSAMSQMPNGR